MMVALFPSQVISRYTSGQAGVIEGRLTDACTGQGLGKGVVSTHPRAEQVFSHKTGYYAMVLIEGHYRICGEVRGYHTLCSGNIEVRSLDRIELSAAFTPIGGCF